MKRLNLTPVTTDSGFPVKKGTWEFLQDSHKETVSSIIKGMIGKSYSDSKIYRIFGAELTNTGGDAYTNTEGAVFYNGEVYLVDAVTGTFGTNMPDGMDMEIYTTQYTSFADPVTFTDMSVHNVHDIRKMRYKNNPAPVLGIPVESKFITKFSGNVVSGSTITDEITVRTDCNRYYRINALGGSGSPIKIKIDGTNRSEGCKAKIYVNTDTSSGYIEILSLASGSTLDIAGNVNLGDESAMVTIEYFGNGYYACEISQAYAAV